MSATFAPDTMKESGNPPHDKWTPFLEAATLGLLCLCAVVGFAHLQWSGDILMPERLRRIFDMAAPGSLGAWLGGLLFFMVACLCVCGFMNEGGLRGRSWAGWIVVASGAMMASLVDGSRFAVVLGWQTLPVTDAFSWLFLLGLAGMFAWAAAGFLLPRLRTQKRLFRFAAVWFLLWTASLLVWSLQVNGVSEGFDWALLTGMFRLAGTAALIGPLAGYVFTAEINAAEASKPSTLIPSEAIWVHLGIAAAGCAAFLIQFLLARMLTVTTGGADALYVVSLAAVGAAFGAMLGHRAHKLAPEWTLCAASLLLLPATALAFGGVVLSGSLSVPAVCCAVPVFVLTGLIFAISLVKLPAHTMLGSTLFGVGLGAVAVEPALHAWREEGAMALCFSLVAVSASCFLWRTGRRSARAGMIPLLGLAVLCLLGARGDWVGQRFNVVTRVEASKDPAFTPEGSASSVAGRVDLIKRAADGGDLRLLENSRILDKLRGRPFTDYQIDPRLPHTMFQHPRILLVGVAHESLVKTARRQGGEVTALMFNPALRQLFGAGGPDADPFDTVNVVTSEGRRFLETTDARYDLIVFEDAYRSRSNRNGRNAVAESLHTREAVELCMDRLADDGLMIFGGEADSLETELPFYKQLNTIRSALLRRNQVEPERNTLVYQWSTRAGVFRQIVVKKYEFKQEELVKIAAWLEQAGKLKSLEDKAGSRMGSQHDVKIEILHFPGKVLAGNVSRILRNDTPAGLEIRYLLAPTTDDKPFPMDVHPARERLRASRQGTLWISAVLLAWLAFSSFRRNGNGGATLRYGAVAALAGMCFVFVAVVFLHRYAGQLSSPGLAMAGILGTLCIGAGAGAWISRNADLGTSAWGAVGAMLMLIAHIYFFPDLLDRTNSMGLTLGAALGIMTIAPLAVLMGLPLPAVLKQAGEDAGPADKAPAFVCHLAFLALSVPLSLLLAMTLGQEQTIWLAGGMYALIAFAMFAQARDRGAMAAGLVAVFGVVAVLLLPLQSSALPATSGRLLGAEPGKDMYEVFALRYGTSDLPLNKVMQGGPATRQVKAEWMFWLIRGKGTVMLVDTGFDDKTLAKANDLSDFKPASERLLEFGVRPEEVTDVVLTNLEKEHVANIALFVNADIWLQESEYSYAAHLLETQPKRDGETYRAVDLAQLKLANEQGRLKLVEDEQAPVPGMKLQLCGYRTPGSQALAVSTDEGIVALMGNAAYMYVNILQQEPIGDASNPDINRNNVREWVSRAGSPWFMVPSHDPRVMEEFPQVMPGVVRIGFGTREVDDHD